MMVLFYSQLPSLTVIRASGGQVIKFNVVGDERSPRCNSSRSGTVSSGWATPEAISGNGLLMRMPVLAAIAWSNGARLGNIGHSASVMIILGPTFSRRKETPGANSRYWTVQVFIDGKPKLS